MEKGIIYVMTTAVPGLIKIGRTGSDNFEQRMYNLEQNGYRNVTGLKREFAIEVEEYKNKENLLDTIFEKSRVSDTELFAVDKNIVIQLLSSFEGKMIYPKVDTKEAVFEQATDNISSNLIPNGVYTFERKKKSKGSKLIKVKAKVEDGYWTILKGSILSVKKEGSGSQGARDVREALPLDENGKLLEDANIGKCSPTFAGVVVCNYSVNGWQAWKNSTGKSISVYKTNALNQDSEE